MDKKRLFRMAYRVLENSTPLRMDCGELCSKACCKGDQETGMHLFPGEEQVYADPPSFLSISPTHIEIKGHSRLLIALCKGSCNRRLRPLSCRVFPLIPYLDKNNVLSIIMDPRAAHLCPIAGYTERNTLNLFFVRNVRNAFRLLMHDKEIKEYIVWLSRQIDDFNQLKGSFDAKTDSTER
ncbi:MAG: hypothetical protein N2484_05350 [Clostridia bacterium]|nr:hypothetical protein [Clostridia bacterium]